MTAVRRHWARCVLVASSLFWSAPSLAKSSLVEQRLKEFHQVVQVVGQDDGGAVVVTVDKPSLMHITSDGQWEELPHPDVGLLLAAAARGPELWLLGSQRVQYRSGRGAWAGFELPAGFPCAATDINEYPRHADGTSRPSWYTPETHAAQIRCPGEDSYSLSQCHISAIATGKAAVACSHQRRGTSTIVTLDASAGVAERIDLPRLVVTAIAPGNRGALLACVWSNNTQGFLELRVGKRILRYQGARPALNLPEVELELLQSDPDPSWVASMIDDGDGGLYLATHGDVITHSDDSFAFRTLNVPRGLRNGNRLLARDVGSGDLLVLTDGWEDGKNRIAGELVRVDAKGRIVDTQLVRIPRDMVFFSYSPISFSAVAGRIWIASGIYVLRGSGDTWTYYAGPKQEIAWQDDPEWQPTLRFLRFTGGASGLGLAGAGGAWWASSIHGERYWATAGQVGGGALLALGGSLLAATMEVGLTDGPVECVLGSIRACVLSGPEVAAATTFAGLGTWATGEAMGGSQSRGAALGGSLGGAVVGTLSSIPLNFATFYLRVPHSIRYGITIATIAAGATIGYQLAGGGPR